MAYTFKSDTSYLMPYNFGPAWNKDVFHYNETTSYAISYVTDRDAIAALIPPPLEPYGEPVVRVSCSTMRGVDFLGGGDYNLVSVNLSVIFRGKKDNVIGSYPLAVWENKAIACILGRELWGCPKLYAHIPDPKYVNENGRSFYAAEESAKLLQVDIKNVAPMDGNSFTRYEGIDAVDSPVLWMVCVKYIPTPDWKGADLIIPTALPLRGTTEQAWVGESRIRFFEPTFEDAPVSHHILKGLQTLIVREYLPASITKGSTDLLISQSKNLE